VGFLLRSSGRSLDVGLRCLLQPVEQRRIVECGPPLCGQIKHDALIVETTCLQDPGVLKLLDHRCDGLLGAKRERAKARAGPGLNAQRRPALVRSIAAVQNARQGDPTPAPRCLCHTAQDGVQLLSFGRQTGVRRWWDLDAVVAGHAAVDGTTSKVGVDVAVAAFPGSGESCDLVYPLRLDRIISFQQGSDPIRGV